MGTTRKPPAKKAAKQCDEPVRINGSFAFAIKTVMNHADKKIKSNLPPSAKEEDNKKE